MPTAEPGAPMGMIAELFTRLHGRLDLTTSDHQAFDSHVAGLKRPLEATFGVSKIVRVGSHARDSAIRASSDVDLLVVVRREDIMWGGRPKTSDTILDKARKALRETYPQTDLRKDSQAITVKFSDGRAVDVVPAYWLEAQQTGWPTYGIPDGSGGWMRAAPDTHNDYIRRADARAPGRIARVGQLFRHWRDAREARIPISGFYVEMLMATRNLAEVRNTIRTTFAVALREIGNRGAPAIADPCKVCADIAACGTAPKLRTLLDSAAASLTHAERALALESVGRESEARRQWEIVFNGQFP